MLKFHFFSLFLQKKQKFHEKKLKKVKKLINLVLFLQKSAILTNFLLNFCFFYEKKLKKVKKLINLVLFLQKSAILTNFLINFRFFYKKSEKIDKFSTFFAKIYVFIRKKRIK